MFSQKFDQITVGSKDLKHFGLLMGGVLLLVGRFIFPPVFKPLYLYILGISLIVLGITMPTALKPFYRLWMGVALVLGWLMTRILLALFFILMIVPTRYLLLLLGKKLLDVKINKQRKSYWLYRDVNREDSSGYEKQY